MTVHLYVHPAYGDCVFHPQTTVLFAAFRAAGARVWLGRAGFEGVNPSCDDVVVTYGGAGDVTDVVHRFAHHRRWALIVDEQRAGDAAAYDRALDHIARHGIANLLVTYQNAAHLARLAAAGVRYLVMPHCIDGIRPRIVKARGVLVSGQMDATYYPARWRAATLLLAGLPGHVEVLPYPGFDLSTAKHRVTGEGYLNYLDDFRLATVCRAGHRDRMVGKYVEFAASNVLPIGDCPTYMPRAMKEAMVDVSAMDDVAVVSTVRRLLDDPIELGQRVEAYGREVAARYLALPNAQRIVSELSTG